MVARGRLVLHEQLLRARVRHVFGARLQVRLGSRDGELALRAGGPAGRVVPRRPLATRGEGKPHRLHCRTLHACDVPDVGCPRAPDAAPGQCAQAARHRHGRRRGHGIPALLVDLPFGGDHRPLHLSGRTQGHADLRPHPVPRDPHRRADLAVPLPWAPRRAGWRHGPRTRLPGFPRARPLGLLRFHRREVHVGLHARLLLLRRVDALDELVAHPAVLFDEERTRRQEDGVPCRGAPVRRPAALLLPRDGGPRLPAGHPRRGDERRLCDPLPRRAAGRDDRHGDRRDVLRDDVVPGRQLQRGGGRRHERALPRVHEGPLGEGEDGRRAPCHGRGGRAGRCARVRDAVCAGCGRPLQPLQQGLRRVPSADRDSDAVRHLRAPLLEAVGPLRTRRRHCRRTGAVCRRLRPRLRLSARDGVDLPGDRVRALLSLALGTLLFRDAPAERAAVEAFMDRIEGRTK